VFEYVEGDFLQSDQNGSSPAQHVASDTQDEAIGNRLAIVIMVEPGFLEWQSILLCSALAQCCKTPYAVHPYCRADRINALHPFTKEFLNAQTEGVRPINPAFNGEYPNGNKIYACAEHRKEQYTLFLDTDILPLRPFDLKFLMRPNLVAGVQGKVATWSNATGRWKKLYALAGCDGPDTYKVVGDETLAHPYLNAGFVFFSDPEMARKWLDVALMVDFDETIEQKRPWLDQITLPVAVAANNSALAFLPNQWNRNCDAEVAQRQKVKLLHYHTLINIVEKGHKDFADALLKDAVNVSLEELVEMLKNDGVDIFKPGLQQRLHAAQSGLDGFLNRLMKKK
jgi:hypothetical protein